MTSRPCVLFVNLRRIEREGFAAILAARRLGYDVVLLTSRTPPPYAAGLVAWVEQVDTYHLDQAVDHAVALARRFNIQAVPSWTEIDVELVAHIARRLGLPGSPPDAAHRARNKYAMKQALAHLDVIPRFARVRTADDLEASLRTIGFPAVIKPTGASGSKGIFNLHSPDDAHTAFDRLQQIAQPSYDPVFRQFGAEFIVEEFLFGPEVSVEGFVSDGQVSIAGITDKWTTDPFHLEFQHVFPSALPADTLCAIEGHAATVIQALGIDYCSFHLEAKLTPRGFRFIETAARPAGDYIASHLVPLASGIDFFAEVTRVALGQPPRVERRDDLHCGVRFVLAAREGEFRGVAGLEAVLDLTAVEHVFVEVKPGTTVLLPPRHFVLQRVAAVVARHPEYPAVVDTLEEAAQRCGPLIGAPAAEGPHCGA